MRGELPDVKLNPNIVIKPEQLSAFDLLFRFFNEDFRLKKKSLRSRLPEERDEVQADVCLRRPCQ